MDVLVLSTLCRRPSAGHSPRAKAVSALTLYRLRTLLTLCIYVFMIRCTWDPGKAVRNHAKHGVTFDEAATSLNDPSGLDRSDPSHSETEDRRIRVAMSSQQRILTVAYTLRSEYGQTLYRLISARPASRRERQSYTTPPGPPTTRS